MAPIIDHLHPPGVSLLTGILILTLMILPTVALTVDASLADTRSDIAVGIMLGSGRTIGETMTVLMVAGNVVQQPDSVFDSVRTLTANIALEMSYATGDHRGFVRIGLGFNGNGVGFSSSL